MDVRRTNVHNSDVFSHLYAGVDAAVPSMYKKEQQYGQAGDIPPFFKDYMQRPMILEELSASQFHRGYEVKNVRTSRYAVHDENLLISLVPTRFLPKFILHSQWKASKYRANILPKNSLHARTQESCSFCLRQNSPERYKSLNADYHLDIDGMVNCSETLWVAFLTLVHTKGFLFFCAIWTKHIRLQREDSRWLSSVFRHVRQRANSIART